MKDSYDYFHLRDKSLKVTCTNCVNWAGKRERCSIEAKVKRNDKTELVHEEVRVLLPRGVMGVFK